MSYHNCHVNKYKKFMASNIPLKRTHSRSSNYTIAEKIILIDLVKENKTVVESKRTDGATSRKKEITWQKITDLFNSTNNNDKPGELTVLRSQESLKSCWDNIKRNCRKMMSNGKVSGEKYYDEVRNILLCPKDESQGPLFDCDVEYIYEQGNEPTNDETGNDEGTGDDLSKIKILVIENANQVSQITQDFDCLRKIIVKQDKEADAEQMPQTPRTPASTTICDMFHIERPDNVANISASVPITTATVPSTSNQHYKATLASHNYAKLNSRTQQGIWRHCKRPVRLRSESAEAKLANAKLALARLTKQQVAEEGKMRKELLALRLKHKKILLEMSEFDLKRKKKLFEREFGTLD